MIVSRTPFRISFVGGGTDLRSFYAEETGRVLSTSINKFIYVVVNRQIGIVEYKYRISWSKTELCNCIDEIEHPIVREALRLFEIDFPVAITTFADIPANTGLGSSSAFAVGLVHALHALKGQLSTKYMLAEEAAHIEVDLLGRIMGKQDHFASAFGNLNVLSFHAHEKVTVDPVFYVPKVKDELEQNLLLFYTQVKRDASEVLKSQNRATPAKREVLRQMSELVTPLREVLSGRESLSEFGRILHRGWMLKRSVAEDISSSQIDEYYERARAAGALGGKLLGAGGGGFLLFYVEPQHQAAVKASLPELPNFKFGLDEEGSRITYYDQTI